MKERNKIKRGQRWKSKMNGTVLEIQNKASGNRHWTVNRIGRKKAHHIHEGTLLKFYELET